MTDGKEEITEYDDKGLLFKGNYENGEKNGKGKEFDENGSLIFEGEYLNGEQIKY